MHGYICALLQGKSKLLASIELAKRFYPDLTESAGTNRAHTIRKDAMFYLRHFTLPGLKQGCHQKIATLIDEEDFRHKCQMFMHSLKPGVHACSASLNPL